MDGTSQAAGSDARLRGNTHVLVACEWSGRVRDAFRRQGYDAWSCDLEPSEGEYSAYHFRENVLDILYEGWDMMIAFPPCTYLTYAGNTVNYRGTNFELNAIAFVRLLMAAPIPLIAIENPPGSISKFIRPPDDVIEPWYFGDPFYKKTCLWLQGLPLLRPDNIVMPVERWVNSRKGGMVRDPKLRGKTFEGIARAMSEQWP